MLYYENLENIVFNKHQLLECDELVIISGYVGPTPIEKLGELPIKSTVIYGMYGCDGIQRRLHEALAEINEKYAAINILYSTIPIHAKCYVWKNKGNVCSALVGSANFSTNGLTTPFKEMLSDATSDTFAPLNNYLNLICEKAICCANATVSENKSKQNIIGGIDTPPVFDENVCTMPLYVIENGRPVVPPQSGINWGLAKLTGSHVNINDAYIRIGADLLEHYPNLFPPKQECPLSFEQIGRAGHRHNDNIEILWDDGTSMVGLLEGSLSKEVNGIRSVFPKQISSTPSKATLGCYIRKRLGVPEGYQITYEDLLSYGRTSIDVSLQGEGVYFFDFSVPN